VLLICSRICKTAKDSP